MSDTFENLPLPETHWETQGRKTTITGRTGVTLGYIRVEQTAAGPRWFALRVDGAYATPAEGRARHAQAAQDFMAALATGEIE